MNTRRSQRRARRAQRRAMRRQQRTAMRLARVKQRAQRRAFHRTSGQTPARKRRQQRRKRMAIAAALLLLIAWLSDCSCAGKRRSDPPKVVATSAPADAAAAPEPIREDRLPSRARPQYENTTAPPIPWLNAFQLQVAARSPRLAECFVGVSTPGSLRWTVSVTPSTGQVSDHTLVPVQQNDALSSDQQRCVISVLSTPSYRLQNTEERPTPTRVSLIIEFS